MSYTKADRRIDEELRSAQHGICCTECNAYDPKVRNDGGMWTAFYKCDACQNKKSISQV